MLGSLWAANEIVLGSFLHNVGVPFTGTILASIGVAVLVAGLRLWDDPGIVWRAGVICSLMKSISPSSVILGPMIGILAEAGLLYLFVILFRRSWVGCLLGGIAASMTPILQKIISILVAYGADAARMYASLFALIADRMQLTHLSAIDALWVLVGTQAVPGALAAAMGMLIARNARTMKPGDLPASPGDAAWDRSFDSTAHPYSLTALVLHCLLIVSGLTLLPLLPQLATPVPVVFYLIIVLVWYPALRQKLTRARLWIEFGAVALLAGILLGVLAPEGKGTWWTGLQSGVAMTARAALVVTGFSAVSIELRNPVVVHWFLRRGLGTLSSALQMAFRALPIMVHSLSRHRSGFRHPVRALSSMMAVMLAQLENSLHLSIRSKVYLLTGEQGAGKTTYLANAIPRMRAKGLTVGGILAHVLYADSKRIGYDVENVLTGERLPLCRTDRVGSGQIIGPFAFLEAGLALGEQALAPTAIERCDVVIVDEVGPLELQGGGWARSVHRLLETDGKRILLVVRPALVEKLQSMWGVVPALVRDVKDADGQDFLPDPFGDSEHHMSALL
jgi:nucleoside-triphosphatase THEP1